MVQEALVSDDLKREVELKLEEGRKKILEDIANQLQQEKQAALAEARKREVLLRTVTDVEVLQLVVINSFRFSWISWIFL